MEVHERIKEIRNKQKHWTKAEMAEKLHIHPNTYSNIESGITNLPFSRLKQIAKVFDMELSELVGASEKNVLNVKGTTCNTTQFNQSHITSDAMEVVELKHELEKCRLLVERLEKENAYLKGIIEMVRQERRGG
jgi:transcriptional regulator with XRE-family HTH domain